MGIYELRAEMLVKRSISEVFSFFKDPKNLGTLTPPWLSFRIDSERVVMQPGAEIEYRIRLMGVPMHWKSIISDYEPPFRFIDEQAIGPYKSWRHTHTFSPTEEGTVVVDRVQYSLPLGPLGRIAHAVLVRHQLMAIFNYRQKALSDYFHGETARTHDPSIKVLQP